LPRSGTDAERGRRAPPLTDLKEIFGVAKPAIAMAHLPPLPGTPLYDEAGGPDAIVASVRRDVEILTASGFDGVMFCNEGDRPYELTATFEGVAMMARVVAEVAPRDRPFGVDYLWDPNAALAVAAATGASFIREVATGVYESDMGLWAPDAAKLLRRRRELSAEHVAVFMNITPEFASTIGNRTIAQTARSVRVSSLADAILVSGPMAGAEPSLDAVREAKSGSPETPVFANTGVKSTNVRDFLSVADGVIVGSDLKVDGGTWNPVDPERAQRFMAEVQEARKA
jgi:membrane complex biogenesis BtpA family protein